MDYIVFDIETIPETETAHLWTPKDEKEFPPLHVHKIQTIGYCVIGANSIVKKLHSAQLRSKADLSDEDSSVLAKASEYITMYDNERDLLFDFLQQIIFSNREYDVCFVSQHGTKFDMAVLLTRMFSYSIRTDWYYGYKGNKFINPESTVNRPRHIDIKHEFADGMFKGHSLDHMAQLAGLVGKGEVDGSKTYDLYKEGKDLTVAEYCLTDVLKTAFVFLKHCLISANADSANADWEAVSQAMSNLKHVTNEAATLLKAVDNLCKHSDWNKYNPNWRP